MSAFGPIEVALSDGRRATVRTARPDDAPALAAYVVGLTATTEFIVTQRDEVLTPERYRERLESVPDLPGALWLVAEPVGEPGVVVGDCVLRPGERRKLAHSATLGMGLAEGWRGRGLGRAMLAAAIDWARAHPALLRLDLGVIHGNARAIALYESLGFEHEGRERWRIRQPDGTLVDELRMGLWVGPGEPPGRG